MAPAAGRSPSAVENAYATAVASKRDLPREKTISKAMKGGVGKAYSPRKEDKTFRPDTRGGFRSISAESLEYREYNENSRPAVVERKGKVDEEFIQAT